MIYIVIDKAGNGFESNNIITSDGCITFDSEGNYVAGDLSENEQAELSSKTFDPKLLSHLYFDVGRNNKCPCGSGKKFKKCAPKACNRDIIRAFNRNNILKLKKKNLLPLLIGIAALEK